MTINETLFTLFLKPKYRYKGIPITVIGLPAFASYHKGSIKNALSFLNRKDYISMSNGKIFLTQKGEKYYKKNTTLKNFSTSVSKTASKNLIVMFDIPEAKKTEREWFRRQLRNFGYEMIQRSVWVGPSPLPVDFKTYTKTIGLEKMIKTFKLAKSYIEKS